MHLIFNVARSENAADFEFCDHQFFIVIDFFHCHRNILWLIYMVVYDFVGCRVDQTWTFDS